MSLWKVMKLVSDLCTSATVFMCTFTMRLPCTIRIQKGFQVQLLFHELKATSSSFTTRNTSFWFAGAEPSARPGFPGDLTGFSSHSPWPDCACARSIHRKMPPGGLGFASNVHLALGKKSKCEEEGKILLPLSQRHPNAKEMCALDVDHNPWWSGHH